MNKKLLGMKCIQIIDTYFFFIDTQSREDWENNKKEFIKKISTAKNEDEVFCTIKTLLATLKDAHTELLYKEKKEYIIPFNFLFEKGKLYGVFDEELVEIEMVNNFPIKDIWKAYKKSYEEYPLVLVEEAILKDIQYMERSFAGKSISIKAQNGVEKNLHPITMKEWMANLDTNEKIMSLNSVNIERINENSICIQIITFRDKTIMLQIREGLSKFQGQFQTIIFDIRNNPGGYIDVTKEVVSNIIETPITLDYFIAKYDREKISYDSVYIPSCQLKYFKKKEIIIFVNYRTMSSAENIFSKALQLKGYTIVGEKTAGVVDQATVVPLDINVELQVTTKRYIKNGKYLKGGIVPDINIGRNTLEEGKDMYWEWFYNYQKNKCV